MLGAIIGDIAGSVYERPENNIKTKDFPFFDRFSQITDDTVLTCAVANAFMEYLAHPKITDLRNTLIDSLKSYGNAHQFVPYGKQFRNWMEDYRDKDPYNSFGNGSAMPHSIKELGEILDKGGYAKVMWCGDRECEDKIKELYQATARCLPFDQIPFEHKCLVCGKEAKKVVFFARAY